MTLNSTTSRTRLYSLLLILSTTVLALSQAHPPLHAGREHHLAAAAAEHIVRPEDHHPYFDANSGRDDRVKVVRETVWLPRPTASASGNGEGGNDGGASSSSSSGAGGGFSGAPLNAGQGFQNKREPSAHILTSLRALLPLFRFAIDHPLRFTLYLLKLLPRLLLFLLSLLITPILVLTAPLRYLFNMFVINYWPVWLTLGCALLVGGALGGMFGWAVSGVGGTREEVRESELSKMMGRELKGKGRAFEREFGEGATVEPRDRSRSMSSSVGGGRSSRWDEEEEDGNSERWSRRDADSSAARSTSGRSYRSTGSAPSSSAYLSEDFVPPPAPSTSAASGRRRFFKPSIVDPIR